MHAYTYSVRPASLKVPPLPHSPQSQKEAVAAEEAARETALGKASAVGEKLLGYVEKGVELMDVVDEGEYVEKAITVLKSAAGLAQQLGIAASKANFVPELAVEIVGVFDTLSAACPFMTPVFAVAKVLLQKYQVCPLFWFVGLCARISLFLCLH